MTFPQPSSSSSVPRSPQVGTQEPDELTRFRDDWKHEVGLHHHADVTHEPLSAGRIPPLAVDVPPVAQHYSAEELPQAQDSFVSLQRRRSLFSTLTASYRPPLSIYSSGYTSQRMHSSRAPSPRA